jgi:putative nucleotidyltransferase with HDIG domain
VKSGKKTDKKKPKKDERVEKKQLNRSEKKQRVIKDVLVYIGTVFFCYAIILTAVMPKKYDIKPGERSTYDIYAPRNVVNMVLTQKRAEEMRNQIQPVVVRTDISSEQLNTVTDIFMSIRNLRNEMAGTVAANRYDIPGFQSGAIAKGDIPVGIPIFSKERKFLDDSLASGNKLLESYHIEVTGTSLEDIYIYASDREIDQLEKSIRDILTYVYEHDIFDDNLDTFLEFADIRLRGANIKGHLDDIGLKILNLTIKPNCIIDHEHTKMLKDQAYANVMQNNKVVINANERIVSIGDIVTEDIYVMLEDLNMIKDGKTNYYFYVSVFLITVLIFVFLFGFYFTVIRNIKKGNIRPDNSLMIGSIIILMLAIARLMPSSYFYFIPIYTVVMLLTVLANERVAFTGHLVVILCISFMYNWDIPFMVTSICVGTFTVYLMKSFKMSRSRISLCGLIAGGLNVLVLFAFAMYYGWTWKDFGLKAAMIFLNGLFSAVITLGFLPVFEMAFDVITQFKLLELINPKQELLKDLMSKAPGTYHHSLMVANLAHQAAEAIGGDGLLARIGAYYHDIGKLGRPAFFSENQRAGYNPHDRMNRPDLSKKVIMEHVEYGLALARKYKLPSFIDEFIVQHHGTTLVAYFYHKAKERDKEGNVKEEDYRYKGTKPMSVEAAVVMLADSVEAAVKSLDFSEEELTKEKLAAFIDRIIRQKYEDGQLEYCDLTFADLTKIRDAFVEEYNGYFKMRNIEYPNGNGEDEANNSGKDGDNASK